MTRNESSWATAFQTRRKAALEGISVQDRLEEYAIHAVDEVQDRHYQRLHELGGWTKVIRRVIGPEPLREMNDLGLATVQAWYVWNEFYNIRLSEIRLRTAGTFASRFRIVLLAEC